MKQIKVLDCTLRDGGRIIDCNFQDNSIRDISSRLAVAKMDIIEMGFLRNPKKVKYKRNTTFFTKISQVNKFINKKDFKAGYVVFIDYSLFDFATLEECDPAGIDGIRVGFTKDDFVHHRKGLIKALELVKAKGYDLYIQGVNSLAYSDKEFLEILDMVNEINPKAFAIVDTYGAMYLDDLQHIYRITNKNLKQEISIAFHSHNNFQLSFAHAQEFIKLGLETGRNIIIDATLNGMGKCAGNLNTELIVDFLIRKLYCDYDFEAILDLIDDYMYNIKKQHEWGYSIPSVMAAVYQSHPNNVIYLTEKYRLATKDIKHIISMIPPETRKRYDYDLIKDLYIEHNHTKVDDKETLQELKALFGNNELLLLLPGKSILDYRKFIREYIKTRHPIVIPVNFSTNLLKKTKHICFFGSEKRYLRFIKDNSVQNIVVSNVRNHNQNDFIVNYESLIERNNENFDTSIIMLLNLLYKLDVKQITIAGFDGFIKNTKNYFIKSVFEDGRYDENYETLTENTKKMLKVYARKVQNKQIIRFLTPSMYEEIFCDAG